MDRPTRTELAALHVARAIAGAGAESIAQEIAAAALDLTSASGAWIGQIAQDRRSAAVMAAKGRGTPRTGSNAVLPLDGDRTLGPDAGSRAPARAEAVVRQDIALVLMRTADAQPFSKDDHAIAAFLADIVAAATDRIRVETDMREKHERFRSLAENAADAIVTLDAQDRILFANPAAERIFGYPQAKLLEIPFTNLIPERYRELHRAGMRHYIATGIRRVAWDGIELVGLHRSGHEIPLEITFGEFQQGNARYFTGVMRDISERKRIQEERDRLFARESEARAHAEMEERRSSFLTSAGVLLSTSLDMGTTLQNLATLAIQSIADWCVIDLVTESGAAERVAGAHADPMQQPLIDEMMQYPVDLSSETPAAHALRDGEPLILNDLTEDQLRGMTRSDEYVDLIANRLKTRSVMALPLHVGGDLFGVITLVRTSQAARFHTHELSFLQDLSSRAALAVSNARHYAAAEAARAEAEVGRQELESVIEGKSRLIRGFSHDIKNPLGAADGYAQLLLDGLMGELSDRQRGSIERIRAGIATALSLINDVVEFSRAESGQIEVRPHPFNADALVREVVDEHRAAAEQAGITVAIGELRGVDLTCDATRIRQILGNLISNAIKYGSTNGDVEVAVHRDTDESPRVVFSVADSGPGIPIEKQHLQFEEFTRLHTGRKEGSGLGLAISRRIARVLGGDILVDSGADRGSTFTLWIPVPSPS
jgi:PAS domain S-box-containing protein